MVNQTLLSGRTPWKGDAFVALHGSWNRALRTGYKIVRLPFKDGKPTGEYQDFVIGFVANQENVWGRPRRCHLCAGRLSAVQR
jgi:glucose/arabinose dehydrogenase